MTDLFTIPESRPPRIVELRRQYDEAKTEYDDATEDAAPCGKAPDALWRALEDARNALEAEEAQITKQQR